MTTKIQQENFIRGIDLSKIQRRRRQNNMAHDLFFTQICYQCSCKAKGIIQVLRLKIPKTQCDWID